MDYNTVSFPGLGIGEFTIDPTAVRITDNITIEWYAIIICAAILIAYFSCDRLAKRFNVNGNDILDVLLIALPSGFIGARVWYILGDLESFDSLLDMISVWNGGLAIYGGIFGGCLGAYFVFRHKKKTVLKKPYICRSYQCKTPVLKGKVGGRFYNKSSYERGRALGQRYESISFLNFIDLAGIGFMIGQGIGRWGNFANVEVFGARTDLPWRMGVGVDCIAEYVHPLFLYESLWNLLGLLLVFAYMDSRKFKGEIFLMYTAWYGIGRAWMEPLRDTSYNLMIFGVKVNMLLAIVLAVAAVTLLFFVYLRKPQKLMLKRNKVKKETVQYEAQFDYAKTEQEVEKDDNDH